MDRNPWIIECLLPQTTTKQKEKEKKEEIEEKKDVPLDDNVDDQHEGLQKTWIILNSKPKRVHEDNDVTIQNPNQTKKGTERIIRISKERFLEWMVEIAKKGEWSYNPNNSQSDEETISIIKWNESNDVSQEDVLKAFIFQFHENAILKEHPNVQTPTKEILTRFFKNLLTRTQGDKLFKIIDTGSKFQSHRRIYRFASMKKIRKYLEEEYPEKGFNEDKKQNAKKGN